MNFSRTLLRPLLSLYFVLGLAGCASAPAAPPTPAPSAWSQPVALAETTLDGAPALVMTADGWAMAWAEGSALRFAPVQADGGLGAAQTVVLGRAPWNPTLLPIPGGNWHLLWQDTDRLGEVRLYSALLNPDGTLSRGPLSIAPDPITTYTAAVNRSGTAAVIWADAAPRPKLFGRTIDAAGRPAAAGPQTIANEATRPALVAVDGGGWLLTWLQRPISPHAPDTLYEVMLQAGPNLPWEADAPAQRIGSVVLSGPVEYVERLNLGLDATTGYVLTTVRHAGTGQATLSLLAFERASLTSLPGDHQLRLPPDVVDEGSALDTGFRAPAVAIGAIPAEKPALAVDWLTLAGSQRPFLPVALNDGGSLVIAYLQAGIPTALTRTDLDAGNMQGPILAADATGDLSLAWVAPATDSGAANTIWMVTTRPLVPAN